MIQKNKQYLSNLSEIAETDNEIELLDAIVQLMGFLEHSRTIYTGIFWEFENGVYKLFFTKLDTESGYESQKVYEYNNHYKLTKEIDSTFIENLIKLRGKDYLANIRGEDVYVYEK